MASTQAEGGSQPADRQPSAVAANRADPPQDTTATGKTSGNTPRLGDFISSGETRLRDLLAFGMAVEAGRSIGPDGVHALRRTAEAELQAYAFRLLHNQAETIRRQAVDEKVASLPRGLSFAGVVAANLASLALASVAVLLAWLAEPASFSLLSHQLAQFLARFSAGS